MVQFEIDAVRENFRTDMDRLVAQLEGSTEALQLVAPYPAPDVVLEDGRRPFSVVADAAHAIAGTAGLVGGFELREAARRLEQLAEHGLARTAELRRQQQALARVAELCRDAVSVLKDAVCLELDNQRPLVGDVVADWMGQVVSSVGDLDGNQLPPAATPAAVGTPASADDRFTFDEDPAAAESLEEAEGTLLEQVEAPRLISEPALAANPELVDVFREESRGIIAVLAEDLANLRQPAPSLSVLKRMERNFHTVKGAAATVGLQAPADIAARLQGLCERALEEGLDDPEMLAQEVESALLQLRSLCGLDVVTVPPLPADSPERKAFALELQESAEEVRELVSELGTSRAAGAAATLARIFHRLRGSALIVGLQQVGMEAGRLQELCSSGVPARQEVLAGLARLLDDEALVAGVTHHGRQHVRLALPEDFDVWQAFQQEAQELLGQIDAALLRAEQEGITELASSLMRTYHTFKGAANAVGMSPTGELLHAVEDMLDRVIDGTHRVQETRMLSVLLNIQGEIRRHLEEAVTGTIEDGSSALRRALKDALDEVSKSRNPESSSEASLLSGSESFDQSQGATTGASRSVKEPSRSVIEERAEDRRRKGNPKSYVRVPADRLDLLMNLAGELVVNRSRLATRLASLTGLHHELDLSRQRLVDRVEGFRRHNEFSLRRSRERGAAFLAGPVQQQASRGDERIMRFGELEFDRYDELNVLARGLAELSSDLSELGTSFSGQLFGLRDDAETIGGIVSEIQGEITRARMVPLEQLFSRLQLPIREAAEREDRLVRVSTSGDDVSVDKMVAETLFAPMLHLVRNAVAHGIEAPKARSAAGKDATGTIAISARQDGQQIVIEIQDDGAGLDLAGLHRAGVKMGLIPQEMPIDAPEVKRLIFAAGISTKSEVGDVAGRGIGGDVVLQTVDRLNGTIDVGTERGKGTVFIIHLPLTLAITRSLMVRVNKASYAVPLFFVERILPGDEVALVTSLGATRVAYQEGYLPMRPLAQILGYPTGAQTKSPVLILRSGTALFAVQVDEVVGQDEIVVKTLGELLRGHPLLSGFSVRGDGNLALILDVAGLARRLEVRPGTGSGALRPRLLRGDLGNVVEMPIEPSVPTPVPARNRTRVLFVDDSISVRKVAERLLGECNVDAVIAADGVEALEKLRSGGFDLLFTDLEMPRMHGYELLRELQFVPSCKDLPVVVVSSRSSEKHQNEARQLGAAEFISKPFTRDGLEAAIQRHVKARRGSGRS